jgi:SAM-dependent methyltransferase
MDRHDRDLSRAFDGQAEQFERAPVQSDPAALAGLVAFAALPPGARVLDAGCGPGLVAEAFLEGGHRVHGVDLSAEMVRRARERCARFGDRARFEQGSLLELAAGEFDAAVSRFVVHHLRDPLAFVRAQVERLRPGGVALMSDHTTDPEPVSSCWHQEIERARDRTHTRNLTTGELADLLVQAGLDRVQLLEEPFELDFDEWFDRGTPALAKEEVRLRVLAGRARGFDPAPRAGGGITLRCSRCLVRGVKGRTAVSAHAADPAAQSAAPPGGEAS